MNKNVEMMQWHQWWSMLSEAERTVEVKARKDALVRGMRELQEKVDARRTENV